MKPTRLAIVARFGGDVKKAIAYCKGIATLSTNPTLRREYSETAQWLRTQPKGSQ